MLILLGGHFDLDSKISKIKELEELLNDSNIWDNAERATSITSELANLKKEIAEYNEIKKLITDEIELIELMSEVEFNDYIDNLDKVILDIKEKVSSFEIKALLSGEYDDDNCFLEIHPGAGGTEAQDWAEMLLRMYSMFASKNNYSFDVLDKQNGDEAGIKSVIVHIKGDHAYGYFKSEIGVHRLVRISPFDSSARRHTSFAAVNVTPEIAETSDIEIQDDDVRIDVYRSSGCGGQGVNTTDSAVRITHIPTGIVVAVQNERSQLKNKEIAFNILRSKLKKLSDEARKNKINSLKGNENINFGSQIRNYVLEPYSLVKDLRTDCESNNPTKVLDGDILPFIEAYLRIKR
ncbi:MAG: peptide chain release factor 2 [Bacilli bacterium]|nr:peptide chain release factor 2 [Bacilli bacterium]